MSPPMPRRRRTRREPAAPVSSFWRGSAFRAFVATRAALALFAWWTLAVVPVGRVPWQSFPDNQFLDGWLRWDSGWYLSIALHGYSLPAGGGEANVAFYPLYPIAALLGALPLRPFLPPDQAVALGGLVVAQLATLAALEGIRRIAVRRLDEATADRALWLLCLFPFSLFFSAFYATSLFLALAAWAFVCADEERWGRAAILGSLSVVTWSPGLVVCAAVAVEYLRGREWNPRALGRDAIPIALAPLSFAALMLYHGLRFGDALVMLRIRSTGWHRPPSARLYYFEARDLLLAGGEVRCTGAWACLSHPNIAHLVVGCLNLALVPLTIWLSVRAARRFRGGLGLYALGTLATALANGVEGTGRIVTAIFPVFLIAATLVADRAFFLTVSFVSSLVLLLLTFYFTHWMHVT